jgi:hypothetical protein
LPLDVVLFDEVAQLGSLMAIVPLHGLFNFRWRDRRF